MSPLIPPYQKKEYLRYQRTETLLKRVLSNVKNYLVYTLINKRQDQYGEDVFRRRVCTVHRYYSVSGTHTTLNS